MRPTCAVLILSLTLGAARVTHAAADAAATVTEGADGTAGAASAPSATATTPPDTASTQSETSVQSAPGDSGMGKDSVLKVTEPTLVEAPGLAKLEIGGTFQLKGFFHDISASADEDKQLSYELRRARVDLNGTVGDHFSFEGQFSLDGNGRQLGTESVYLAWKLNDYFGIKGGKLKRPFSQEALSSSKSLYTVERSVLYHDFLAVTTGYSFYDVGLVFYGGFVDEDVPVTYEAGVFNGKQTDDPATAYVGQQYEARDAGFKAKDFAFRLQAQPFRPLKVEAALSTKSAEDRSDPENFDYHVNTAYEVGAEFQLDRLRLLGEVAWGDNHQGRDQRIISGSTLFLAFYAMGVWHEDYSRGRASELVLRIEGQDPDFETGSGEGTANDGRLRYTLGANYFFTRRVSVLFDYTVLQAISELPGDDELVHGIEALWRMSF